MRLNGGVLVVVVAIGAVAAGGASAQQVKTVANDQTFTVSNGGFSDGADLTGSLVIDIANGLVVSGDLLVSGIPDNVPSLQPGGNSALDSSIEFSVLNSGGSAVLLDSGNVWSGIDLSNPDDQNPSLELDLSLGTATSLVNYNGGALCVSSGNCDDGVYVSGYTLFPIVNNTNSDPPLTAGTLSSAAPEPASFLLLAVPAVWIIRRQRRSAQL